MPTTAVLGAVEGGGTEEGGGTGSTAVAVAAAAVTPSRGFQGHFHGVARTGSARLHDAAPPGDEAPPEEAEDAAGDPATVMRNTKEEMP